MSRRYGRNQKRRAREEAARLREAVDMANGLARYTTQKNHDLQDEIDRAKELLPEGSILLEPGTIKTGSTTDVPIRMCVHGRVPDSISARQAETFAMRSVPLDVLLTDVVLDQLQDKLHFNVLFADGVWRYSVARRALMNGPPGTEKRLIADISRRLATQLILDLKTNLKYR